MEKIWRREDGSAIPLEECTQEQLIARFRYIVEKQTDERIAWNASREALLKRLQDHRKAKALANKRADAAVTAMKQMLETLGVNE